MAFFGLLPEMVAKAATPSQVYQDRAEAVAAHGAMPPKKRVAQIRRPVDDRPQLGNNFEGRQGKQPR